MIAPRTRDALRIDETSDQLCWLSGDEGVVCHILGDYRTSGDYRPSTDGHASKDDCAGPDPGSVADPHWRCPDLPTLQAVIVGVHDERVIGKRDVVSYLDQFAGSHHAAGVQKDAISDFDTALAAEANRAILREYEEIAADREVAAGHVRLPNDYSTRPHRRMTEMPANATLREALIGLRDRPRELPKVHAAHSTT